MPTASTAEERKHPALRQKPVTAEKEAMRSGLLLRQAQTRKDGLT